MKQPPYQHRTAASRTGGRAGHAGARRRPPGPVLPLAAGGTAVGATAVAWAAGFPAVPVVATLSAAVAVGAVAARRRTRRRAVTGLPGGRRPARRAAADRVVAALAVLLVLPVLLAVALAVALTSRGPVLLRRARPGAVPRLTFRCTDRRGRTTRLGWLLQRSSLDVLPTLLDVVAGRMAFPGPPLPLSGTAPARALRRAAIR
ncbi:hypothetical protein E4P41_09510 [Geodermatophilus sp. DF01-2]|uniref:sugar transferase n=1 Tax=Geodermatophilus sp. DF01-2 TaxID=2559610 RepID=UPI001073ED4C|nr:sugar transferase [Geodermatophilus sp. DF01_2]TFV61648.1 hypothetical protein E4P41_09510 [Geodermatophilus sp. DF01_2]